MPGIQEILVVGAVAVLFFYLPKRGIANPKAGANNLLSRISGTMRLAIVSSLLWLALSAVIWHPWQGDWLSFICWGPGIVVVVWSLYWVVVGFRKKS